MARRLNWIGIAIFVFGFGTAILGAWYVIHVRPKVGVQLDELQLDDTHTAKLFAEEGGENRSFLEVYEKDELMWQGLIPHYSGAKGRPGVAYGAGAITVRVERGGRSEVFAFRVKDGDKLGGFRLAAEHEPITVQPTGPLTLSDHVQSYELVSGPDWHQVIAVDLASGEGKWKTDLGPEPITGGHTGVDGLTIEQGQKVRHLDTTTGRDKVVSGALN